MSRNFEKEYIELAQNEIPDLWDRIEAGLTEKSAPENSGKSRIKRTVFLKRYAGLAATILCAAIMIPAFILIRESGGKSYSTDAYTTEESYDMAAEEAVEEAAEAAWDTTAEAEASEEEYEMDSEAGVSNGVNDAASGIETAGIGEDERTEKSEDQKRQQVAIAESGAAYDEESMDADIRDFAADTNEQSKKESIILKNVTVQVIEEDHDVYGEDEDILGGTVYTVTVVKDASGTFDKGEQIEVFLSPYSSMMMPVGSEFEIDIICEEDGNYPFVIDRIYLQEE